MEVAVPISWVVLGLTPLAVYYSFHELIIAVRDQVAAVDPEDRIVGRIELRRGIARIAGCFAMLGGPLATVVTDNPHVALEWYAGSLVLLLVVGFGTSSLNIRDHRLLRQLPVLLPDSEHSETPQT